MKLLLAAIFSLLFYSTVEAQNWIYLGNDVAGDTESAGPDIDSVFYAIDTGQDSIWFKVTTHGPLGADYSFYFFIDGDENPTNGFDIPSVGFGGMPHPSPNLDMYLDDRFVFVTKSVGSSDAWTEYWTTGGGSQSTDAFFQETSANSLQVSAQLSDVDLHVCEGDFNVIAVSGLSFFGQLSDFAPSSNFYSAHACSATLEEKNSTFTAYPNPCNNQLFIESATSDIKSVTFTNMLGQAVELTYEINGSEVRFETSSLLNGQYVAHIISENGSTQNIRIAKM